MIRDEKGKPQAVRGTISDVTHLVELEAQFHQSQKMEAVGQLAGGLAHDYNNLLTVILGNAELLYADAPNQELEEIISAARSATHVTNRLLTFSRHSKRSARVVRLGDDVREARLLLERAVGKKIEIVLDCNEPLAPVFVDGGQVQQILLNLALNARDAMPEGGTLTLATRTRTLGAEQADSHDLIPGEYVTLEVRDTGTGMNPATLEHIFEPFFTTKEPGQGTGLGLAMVFGAMKQNAGFVEVTSRPGEGSCFRLWFPSVADSPPESMRATAAKRILEILLVEDSHAVARLAMAMLRSVGHQVRVAASGIDALALWREAPADILVTDVVMPGMSGVELADRLRKVRPSLPVLFITGYLPDRVGLVVEAGRSAVVMKPFQRSELLAALEGLVEVSAIG
jgi:nitrogen-specific signal transduction histidine kinase/ActR/RegA family two-component response regulator